MRSIENAMSVSHEINILLSLRLRIFIPTQYLFSYRRIQSSREIYLDYRERLGKSLRRMRIALLRLSAPTTAERRRMALEAQSRNRSVGLVERVRWWRSVVVACRSPSVAKRRRARAQVCG